MKSYFLKSSHQEVWKKPNFLNPTLVLFSSKWLHTVFQPKMEDFQK
jgi:hypothetical protein